MGWDNTISVEFYQRHKSTQGWGHLELQEILHVLTLMYHKIKQNGSRYTHPHTM